MYTYPLDGLQRAMQMAAEAAERINRKRPLEGQVKLIEAEHQFQANLAVIRTENRMYRSLLDIYG